LYATSLQRRLFYSLTGGAPVLQPHRRRACFTASPAARLYCSLTTARLFCSLSAARLYCSLTGAASVLQPQRRRLYKKKLCGLIVYISRLQPHHSGVGSEIGSRRREPCVQA